MNFLEKLDLLISERGLNRRTLSESSGIPYTTIIGFYSKGYEGARMSTIKALARFFNVSTDYLIRDEISNPHYGLCSSDTSELSRNEYSLIQSYRNLNDEGKEKARDYLADLASLPKYKKCSESCMDKEA